jgi:hypothetical protein
MARRPFPTVQRRSPVGNALRGVPSPFSPAIGGQKAMMAQGLQKRVLYRITSVDVILHKRGGIDSEFDRRKQERLL